MEALNDNYVRKFAAITNVKRETYDDNQLDLNNNGLFDLHSSLVELEWCNLEYSEIYNKVVESGNDIYTRRHHELYTEILSIIDH